MDISEEAFQWANTGQLTACSDLCRQVTANDPANARAWGLLGAVLVEQGDLDEALVAIRGGLAAHPKRAERVALYTALSRLWRLQEDWDEALEAAEIVSEMDAQMGQGLRALTLAERGDTGWLEEAGRSLSSEFPAVEDDPCANPWSQTGHVWSMVWVLVGVARARRLRASGSRPAAVLQPTLVYLMRRLGEAEQAGRTHRVIELSVQQALAMDALGDRLRALVALERAVALAQPGAYRNVFREAGEAMQFLLEAFRSELSRRFRKPTPEVQVVRAYVDHLLASFPRQQRQPTPQLPVLQPLQTISGPLTQREKEVLGLLAQGSSYEGIADQLIISMPTVRWHVRSVYRKLGVSSRLRAIARGKELGLL